MLWNPEDGEITSDLKGTPGLFIGFIDLVTVHHPPFSLP